MGTELQGINTSILFDPILTVPLTEKMHEKYQEILKNCNLPDTAKKKLEATVKILEYNRKELFYYVVKRDLHHVFYLRPLKGQKQWFNILFLLDAKDQLQIYLFTKLKKLGAGTFKKVFCEIDYTSAKPIACASYKEKLNQTVLEGIKEYRIQRIFDMALNFFVYLHKGRMKIKILMPLANHGDLDDAIYPEGHDKLMRTLNEKQREQLFNKILEFVAQAHEKGFVLADIKPENFLYHLNEDQSVSVFFTDMGFTYHKKDKKADRDLGSPQYSAPEVIDKKMSMIDQPVDVYALGHTLWNIFVGGEPTWIVGLPIDGYYISTSNYQKGWNSAMTLNKHFLNEGTLENLIYRMMNPNSIKRPTMQEILAIKPTLKLGSLTWQGMRLLTETESLSRLTDNSNAYRKNEKGTFPPEQAYTLRALPQKGSMLRFSVDQVLSSMKNKNLKTITFECNEEGKLFLERSCIESQEIENLEEYLKSQGLLYCLNFYVSEIPSKFK